MQELKRMAVNEMAPFREVCVETWLRLVGSRPWAESPRRRTCICSCQQQCQQLCG